MKKTLKILLYICIAALIVLACFACTPTNSTVDGKIDGELPEFDRDSSLIYGETPDLDVVIDGKLDEEIWQDRKWYSQYSDYTRASFYFTTVMSEKGLYIGTYSKDSFIMWAGRNYFHTNTQVAFYVNTPKGRLLFQMDANNLKPTIYCINARNMVVGEINSSSGASESLNAEFFITWDEMGFTGKQEEMLIFPYYCSKTSLTGTLYEMYPTFVKTLSNGTDEYLLFNEDGYTGGDEQDAIVGSHESGLGRTQGWTVGKTDDGEIASTLGTTYTYPQAAFFRTGMGTYYKVKTTMKVNSLISSIGRAGLLVYKNDINYRAIAVELTDSNFKNGKLENLVVNGYTNYPANVTVTDNFASIANSKNNDEVEIIIFGSNGRMYYIVNGVYVYSEEASYVGLNNMFGLYAFNADVTFSDYELTVYRNEDEAKEAISEYAFTIDVRNANATNAKVEVDQIGVRTDGKGVVTLTFETRLGYTISESGLYYLDSAGNRYDIYQDALKNGSYGTYALSGINDNIVIYCSGERDEAETVQLKLRFRNEATGEAISGFRYKLTGSSPFTRYEVSGNEKDGISTVTVPKGYSWKYVTEMNSFRIARGIVADEQIINADMAVEQVVNIQYPVLGGRATSATSNFTVESNPSSYWDTTREEENIAVFQTTNNRYSYIYFSGPTISDYQVAYIEITNQTDPTAFTSMENDPAVGFVIQSRGNTGFVGMRMGNGLRILPHGMSDFGARVDTGALVSGYDGYLVKTSGGVVQGLPYMGKGTVDRVSYNNREDTTSFLMIRNGGKIHLYLADGSKNVKTDKTNFDKMTKIYEFQENAFAGEAAIGIGVTVSYNLKIKYSNCWILSGAKAANFANDLVSSPINITLNGDSKQYTEFSGDGLFDIVDGVPKRVAAGSNINIRANTSLPANKLLRLTLDQKTVKYVAAGQSTAFTIAEANRTYSLACSVVDAVTVRGTLRAKTGSPDYSKAVGTIYDKDAEIGSFDVNADGSFEFKIPRGRSVSYGIGTNGFATARRTLSASASDVYEGEIEMVALPFGGTVAAPSGSALSTTANGFSYNIDADGNPSATYYSTACDNNIHLALQSAAYRDAVIKFSYTRKSAASSGSSVAEENDLGLGLLVSDGSATHKILMIGTGYRIFQTGETEYQNADEARGLTNGVDIASKDVAGYDIMFIKKDSSFYMFSKTKNSGSYTLINVWQAQDNGGEVLNGPAVFAITMTSMPNRFMNITFTDVTIEALDEQNSAIIRNEITVSNSVGGNITVDKNSSGVAGNNGNVYSVYKQKTVKFTVTPDSGNLIREITVDGTPVDLVGYKGGAYTFERIFDKNSTVAASFVSESDIALISGTVKDQYGEPIANYTFSNAAGFSATTDRNGAFSGMYANSGDSVRFMAQTSDDIAALDTTVKGANGKFDIVVHRSILGGSVGMGNIIVHSGTGIWTNGATKEGDHGFVISVDENGNETATSVDTTPTRKSLMFTGVASDKIVARASIKWSKLSDMYPVAGFIFRGSDGTHNGIGVYGDGVGDVRTWDNWAYGTAKENLGFKFVGSNGVSYAISVGKVDMLLVYDNGLIDYYVRFPETSEYNEWIWLYSGKIFGTGGFTGGVTAIGLTETSDKSANYVWSDYSIATGQDAIDAVYKKELVLVSGGSDVKAELVSVKADNKLVITPNNYKAGGKEISSVTVNGKVVMGTLDNATGVFTYTMPRDFETNKLNVEVAVKNYVENTAYNGTITVGGKHQAGVTVYVAFAGSVAAKATTDAEGKYSVLVEPGAYEIYAQYEYALDLRRQVIVSAGKDIPAVDMTYGVAKSVNGMSHASYTITYDETADDQLSTLEIVQRIQGENVYVAQPIRANGTLSFSFKATEGHSFNGDKYVDIDEYMKWFLENEGNNSSTAFGFQSNGAATGNATTVNNVFGNMKQDYSNRVYKQYDVRIARNGAKVTVYAKLGDQTEYKVHSTFTVASATDDYYLHMLNDGRRDATFIGRTFFNFSYKE